MMKMIKSRKSYCISVVISFIVLVALGVGLTFFINDKFYHQDYRPAVTGHYEDLVYRTATGECYHSENCSYVTRVYEIGLDSAIARGLRPCKHCGGIPFGEILVGDYPEIPERDDYLKSGVISFAIVSIAFAGIHMFIDCSYEQNKKTTE